MSDFGNGDATTTTASITPAAPAPPREAPPAPRGPRFGEELPIFCERCGYSLNGIAQIRCNRCEVLHFACPECNHHQPINTLRPAVQRMLGRLRALGLALVVFLKINFFFWCLFAWGALGSVISYRYDYISSGPSGYTRIARPVEVDSEGVLIIFLWALAFAMIGRMLLLRWRRGVLVGLGIGGLVAGSIFAGAYLRFLLENRREQLPAPGGEAFLTYLFCGFSGALAGASCAWLVWRSLVHMFLPRRAATALIEYQRAMSAPRGTPDRTDATTSVTA
jgi:hypothetical protein